MINPRQLDIKGAYIQDAYMTLEEEIMRLLIERLTMKTKTELSEDTVLQWQLEKLEQLGMMNFDTINELVKKTGKFSKKELENLIERQGFEIGSQANQELAELKGVPEKPWTELDDILHQYFDSQWRDLDNHVNQSLISINYPSKPIAKAYQQVLNDTVAKVLTGFVSPDKALKSAIYELVDKGIMTDFVDKAGRPWSLERYVRTVVQTSKNKVYNELRFERGKDYGIVTALMSSFPAARKACAPIQGGWVLLVPKKDAPPEYQSYESIYDYDYGEPWGTRGINCRHRFYPAIPGVNENTMPKPPSPEEAMKNAEIVAKQRRLEAGIRDAKKKLNAAKSMGDDVDTNRFNNLVKNRQGALRQLIKDNPKLLNRDYSREQVYSPSNLAKESLKKDKAKDKSDYKNVKDILGKNAPQSLDDYRQIRYNEPKKWEQLKDNLHVKKRLNDGRFGGKINPEKQAPHMKSTVTPGKSYFEDDVDVQALFDKYAGTGIVDTNRQGRRDNKEIIVADDVIGIAVSEKSSEKTDTFKIHHSKKRTHIVPIKKNRR